jgi:hypothetical protein
VELASREANPCRGIEHPLDTPMASRGARSPSEGSKEPMNGDGLAIVACFGALRREGPSMEDAPISEGCEAFGAPVVRGDLRRSSIYGTRVCDRERPRTCAPAISRVDKTGSVARLHPKALRGERRHVSQLA